MTVKLRFVLVATLLLSSVQPLNAAVLVTTIKGIANGGLGGQTFQEAAFTITATGETSQIQLPLAHTYQLPVVASVTVEGIGSGTFTNPIVVTSNQPKSIAGFGDLVVDRSILFVKNDLFRFYNLQDSIGPLTGITPHNAGDQFPTTSGIFLLSNVLFASFEATLIPEPASLSLIGIAAVAILRRRVAV